MGGTVSLDVILGAVCNAAASSGWSTVEGTGGRHLTDQLCQILSL